MERFVGWRVGARLFSQDPSVDLSLSSSTLCSDLQPFAYSQNSDLHTNMNSSQKGRMSQSCYIRIIVYLVTGCVLCSCYVYIWISGLEWIQTTKKDLKLCLHLCVLSMNHSFTNCEAKLNKLFQSDKQNYSALSDPYEEKAKQAAAARC